MWSILSNLKKSVVLAPVAIILILAMGCGTAEPAPTAVPASEIASMVREAVQESVPAPAEAGPSAAEIQQLIEAAVSNAPAGVTAAEVQRLVQGAISAAVANAPTAGDCRGGPASCGKLRPPGGGRAAHGGRSTSHRGRVHQVPPCASGRYRAVAGPRASSSPGVRSQGHERRGDPKDGGSSGYRGNGRRGNTR